MIKRFLLGAILLGLLTAFGGGAPEAALILLDDRERVSVNADGTAVTTDECTYLIKNYDGLRRMRSLRMHFNADYGSLEVTALSITKPDGRRIVLDPGKLSTVAVEDSQMESAIFDPAHKVLCVNVPGLEIGDTLEVATVEKLTKPRMPGEWSGIAVMQADHPIRSYEYTVELPEGKPLRAVCVKDEVPGTLKSGTREEKGRKIYWWRATDVPQAVPENAMPPMYSCTQRVLLSTVGTWEEVSRWYHRLCAPRLAAVSDGMRAKVAELTAGKRDGLEKIHALFQFVSQNIRYTGITDEESAPGYEPHDVSRTFERRHGVCRDKAALLAAMLDLAGFKAFPVLFMAGAPKDKEVPNIYFNHAITGVEMPDGSTLLMDATFETTAELFPAYLAGDPFLPAKETGGKLDTAPPVKAESNLLEIATEMAPDGAGGKTIVTAMKFTGVYDQMYRAAFSRWTRNETEDFFAAKLRKIFPGARLAGLEIEPENVRDMSLPLTVTLRGSAPAETGAETGLLAVPRGGMVFGMFDPLYANTFLKKRRFPLKALPRAVRERITVTTAEGEELTLPEKTEIREPGLFRFDAEAKKGKDGKLTETFFLAVDSMLIAPGDYARFRKAAAAAKKRWETLPVIRRRETAETDGANTELLRHAETIRIHDAGSWSETVVFEKKIRNYAGVGEAANFSIPYIEGAETVEVSGYVINSAGKKLTISPKEINRMDAPASAAAPRYLKRRIAVVSFPGVDAGSVIRCTVKKEVTGRMFFHRDWVIRDDTPAKVRELTVDHPEDLPLKFSAVPEGVREETRRAGGRIVRRFTAEGCARLPEEPGQPEYALFAPTLTVSGGDNRALHDALCAAAEAGAAKTDPEIGKLAEKIVSGNGEKIDGLPIPPDADGTARERIRAAFALEKYVREKIREAGFSMEESLTREFSAPGRTLRDGYGSSFDRAILLAALLRTRGIRYRFVPVSALPDAEEYRKKLTAYPEHVYGSLLILLPEYGLFLNDSGRYGTPGILRSYGKLALHDGQVAPLRGRIVQSDGTVTKCAIELRGDDSAEAVVTITFHGIRKEREKERFARFTPALERQHMEKLAAAVSPLAEITESRFDAEGRECTLKLRLHIPGFARRTGRYLSLPVPGYDRLTAAAALPAKPRKNPYLGDGENITAVSCRITVPAGYRPLLPPGGTMKSDIFSWSARTENDGGEIRLDFLLGEAPGIVPAGRFGKLLEIDREINRIGNRNILFITEQKK